MPLSRTAQMKSDPSPARPGGQFNSHFTVLVNLMALVHEIQQHLPQAVRITAQVSGISGATARSV